MKSKILLAMVAVLLTLPFVAGSAQQSDADTGNRDTVRIVCGVKPTITVGDSVAVDIYAYTDEACLAFTLGFSWNSESVEYSSFKWSPFMLGLAGQRKITTTTVPQNSILTGYIGLDPADAIPLDADSSRLLVTLYFKILAGATPGTVIDLDSATIPPAGPFIISNADDALPDASINPFVVNCDVRLTVQELSSPVLPESFVLMQNNPNPFNPTTAIDFAIPKSAHTRIEVFNILGQKIKTLVNEYLGPGRKRVEWDGTDSRGNTVASGVYLYRMTANDFTETKKMMLMK